MTNAARARRIGVAGVAAAALLVGGAVTPTPSSATASKHTKGAARGAQGCDLGNGTKHVVEIVFDNVHFFRDNPNVPSDLEQMPHLLNFLRQNGVVLSNTHTPLIAHTADDSLTIYTGLYGDRHGQPVSNTYKTYNPDGTTDPAASFAYWTDPVDDTLATPAAGHDATPSMVYSANVPTTSTTPNRAAPAPWVPFTRAGCNVGDFSTANMVLENTKLDIPTVFGPDSPEQAQQLADPDSFKDDEVTDYVGVALHCAKTSTTCTDATAVKFGQTTPSPSAVPDQLPTEPGGYNGFAALFGAPTGGGPGIELLLEVPSGARAACLRASSPLAPRPFASRWYLGDTGRTRLHARRPGQSRHFDLADEQPARSLGSAGPPGMKNVLSLPLANGDRLCVRWFITLDAPVPGPVGRHGRQMRPKRCQATPRQLRQELP